jgi:hypothetical protein
MMPPLSLRWWKQRPCPRYRSGYRSRQLALGALALVVTLAVLSACAANPTGKTSTTPTPTATPAPTATPKPKPTSVPTTSVAFCQGLLSLAEANSAMMPPAPATNILFENDSSNRLNACSWTPGQHIAVLAVYFAPFPAGTSLTAAAQQQIAKANPSSGGSIATAPVSGVGDQALYLSTTIPTPAGANFIAELVVADGGVLLACVQTGAGSPPTATQSELKQACTLVVSRL